MSPTIGNDPSGRPQRTATMAERVRCFDWSRTPLGAMDEWPQSLRTVVDVLLAHPQPMILLWGTDLTQIYNDGYAVIARHKHPHALGQANRDCWPEALPLTAPIYERVLTRGESVLLEDQLIPLDRLGLGTLEEAYFTVSYGPCRDDAGRIAGILVTVIESTDRMLADRERERQQAEAARREALTRVEQRAQLLDTALTHINDYAYIFDREGRFLYVNRPLLDLWGLTLEEAVGKNFFGLGYPDELATKHQREIEQVIDSKRSLTGESRYTNPRGTTGHYEYIFNPVLNADGEVEVVTGSTRDITARVRAEEALRTSEEQFRQLADAMPQIVWTARPDGAVDYFNRRWYEFTGLPQDGRKGDETWTSVPDAAGLERAQQLWSDSVRTGRPYQIEYRLRRHDGEYRWHLSRAVPVRDAAGRVVRWFGATTDIHDQKLVTEQLAEATTRSQRNAAELEALIEAMPHAVYFGNEQGITRCNRYALELLGASSLADLQSRIAELGERFHVSYREEPERLVAPQELPFARALRGESAALDTWVTKLDGSGLVCVRGTAAPVAENGEIIGAVAVNFDITDRVRDEQAVREARDAAEAANRAKDKFLAVLSHELRTPLTPVTMAVDMLAADPNLPPAVTEHLAMIRRNVQLEVKLIDDLLDISRVVSGKVRLQIERVDFSRIVQDACESVRPLMHERGVRFRHEIPAESGVVEADPGRLRQVLWNLLINAAKFTPAGQEVVVSVRRETPQRVSVMVRDTGLGIAPEVLPKVFDAFEQGEARTPDQLGGLGLGLAIAKALTELQQGTITAASQGPGTGATFVVTLPLAPSRAAAVPARQRAGSHSPLDPEAPLTDGERQGPRVLVVEDHEDTAQLLSRSLQKRGFHVIRASTVQEALQRAAAERFDVLVSDIGLPDASGYELMEALRTRPDSRNPAIRGIAMSGYGMDEDLRRSREAGFSEHLIKPINLQKLVTVLRQITESDA